MELACHYVSSERAEELDLFRRGLEPKSLPIRYWLFPKDLPSKVLFAFLANRGPSLWKNSASFPGVWHRLMEHIGNNGRDPQIESASFLLHSSDSVFIADWTSQEVLYRSMVEGGMQYCREPGRVSNMQETAKRNYLKSIVPLSDYRGGYQLPEVLIANNIAPERITWRRLRNPNS